MSRFYITTPLYYVNDKPHIGHAYTTITADVLRRYHQFFGEETYFLTGTDEHGQKAQQAAEKRGLSPKEHCDDMVKNYEETWKELDIHYDIFFRTTSEWHQKAVQSSLQQLYNKGDIYKATYEGWYSVSEEIFYNEKDLVDGKSPEGKEVTKIEETNYFFRMSNYREALIEHIEAHPNFICPESRKNEVLGFLKKGLNDLCISRPKSRLNWGIELPFDNNYVTYVWFDALLNYANAVGFQQPKRQDEFEKWWASKDAGAHHLIGKDILTTHAVYWTTMLLALEAPLPKMIFAHGWILNKDNSKMSKSQGDVVNPLDMKDVVGVDPLRYYLMREVHFGNDGPFSQDLVINRVNTELANNLGNLLSRTTNLINKYFDGQAPQGSAEDERTQEVKQLATSTGEKVRKDIERMAPSYALEHIVNLLNEANRFLEERAPWKQAKEDVQAAGQTLYTALECLRIASLLLWPVMPFKIDELLERISCQGQNLEDTKKWGGISPGSKIVKGTPLFPRVQS